jgi:hypothetical protein
MSTIPIVNEVFDPFPLPNERDTTILGNDIKPYYPIGGKDVSDHKNNTFKIVTNGEDQMLYPTESYIDMVFQVNARVNDLSFTISAANNQWTQNLNGTITNRTITAGVYSTAGLLIALNASGDASIQFSLNANGYIVITCTNALNTIQFEAGQAAELGLARLLGFSNNAIPPISAAFGGIGTVVAPTLLVASLASNSNIVMHSNVMSLFRKASLYNNNVRIHNMDYPAVASTVMNLRDYSQDFVNKRSSEWLWVDQSHDYDLGVVITAANNAWTRDLNGVITDQTIAPGTYTIAQLLAAFNANNGTLQLTLNPNGFVVATSSNANNRLRFDPAKPPQLALAQILGFTNVGVIPISARLEGNTNVTAPSLNSVPNGSISLAKNNRTSLAKLVRVTVPLKRLFPYLEFYDHINRGSQFRLELEKNNMNPSEIVMADQAISSVEIKFKELTWWIPTIIPSAAASAFVLKEIMDKKEMLLKYDEYNVYQSLQPRAMNMDWKIDNISAVPKYVYILMQYQNQLDLVSVAGNANINPGTFQHCNLRRAELDINNNPFPKTPYNLNFSDPDENDAGDYTQAYVNWLKIGGRDAEYDNGSLVSYEDYKNLYPIIAFDMSNDQRIQQSGKENNVITIKLAFAQTPPQNVYLWAVIVYEKSMLHKSNGKQIELIEM